MNAKLGKLIFQPTFFLNLHHDHLPKSMKIMVDYLIFQTFKFFFLILFVIQEMGILYFTNFQKIEETSFINVFLVKDGRELENSTKEFILQSLVDSLQKFNGYYWINFIYSNSSDH